MEIASYLEMEDVQEEIEKEILRDFELYDTFYIMNLAFKYELKVVYNKCLTDLEHDEFEQMLYNKYDFMHCDFKLFQIILRIHQVLQSKN